MLKSAVNNANAIKRQNFNVVLIPATVGDRIRIARQSKGLDLEPVAKAVGITVSALSQIETGQTKHPKPETLFKIADALDVEPRYLVFGHLQRVAASLIPPRPSDTGRFRQRKYSA